jgi:nucleoside-diphosphate-sugar epimerase
VGYIGSALAARLIADGHEVVGVENFFSTPREAVLRLAEQPQFTLVEGPVTEPAVIARAFSVAKIETVYHLAAQASAHPGAAPIAYTVDTNFVGTLRVLEAAANHGVARIVLASSTRLYRTPLPRRIHERSPIHPEDLVHLSQRYGEVLLASFLQAARGGFVGISARLGIVHGLSPVMKTDARFLAVPQRFCLDASVGAPLNVATGANTVLPFVHVDDAVEGLLACRIYNGSSNIVNVAGEVRSVASVADAVRTAALERGLDVTLNLVGRSRAYRPRQIDTALATTGFRAPRRVEESAGVLLEHYCRIAAGGSA